MHHDYMYLKNNGKKVLGLSGDYHNKTIYDGWANKKNAIEIFEDFNLSSPNYSLMT
jgi:hypothetical protein